MKFKELRKKEVIDISNGKRCGMINDLIFDECTGTIEGFIIYYSFSFLAFFGFKDELLIPFCSVVHIGDDIILIKTDNDKHNNEQKHNNTINSNSNNHNHNHNNYNNHYYNRNDNNDNNNNNNNN